MNINDLLDSKATFSRLRFESATANTEKRKGKEYPIINNNKNNEREKKDIILMNEYMLQDCCKFESFGLLSSFLFFFSSLFHLFFCFWSPHCAWPKSKYIFILSLLFLHFILNSFSFLSLFF